MAFQLHNDDDEAIPTMIWLVPSTFNSEEMAAVLDNKRHHNLRIPRRRICFHKPDPVFFIFHFILVTLPSSMYKITISKCTFSGTQDSIVTALLDKETNDFWAGSTFLGTKKNGGFISSHGTF